MITKQFFLKVGERIIIISYKVCLISFGFIFDLQKMDTS